jgi:hypothetical protein
VRRRWKVAVVLAALLALGALALLLVFSRRPDYSPREARWSPEEEARRLEAELPLAASKKPYLVLDLLSSKLVYRISGFTPKTIPFAIDSIRGAGGWRTLSREGLALVSLQERGAPREVIKPPDPNKPVDPLKDPKIFPPDPPTDYILSFDAPVKIRIVGEKDVGWKERFGSLRKSIGRWFGGNRARDEVRIQVRLPAEKAQEIYRGLYRGERILVLGLEAASGGKSPAVKGGQPAPAPPGQTPPERSPGLSPSGSRKS